MKKVVGNKIILRKPYPSTRKDKKMMVYLRNPSTGRINIIHFGDPRYKHNYSKTAREKYLKRSAGIKDKKGRLTKDNPFSANYWARKVLWSSNGKGNKK